MANRDIVRENPDEVSSVAKDVFDTSGCVPGIKVHMNMKLNVLSSVYSSRSVPVAVRDGLKQELGLGSVVCLS